jgi:hypothetical protein
LANMGLAVGLDKGIVKIAGYHFNFNNSMDR